MRDAGTVLIVGAPSDIGDIIFAAVLRNGGTPLACSNWEEARKLLQEHHFRLVLCSDVLAEGKYEDVIAAAEPVPVIVLSRFAEWGPYMAALRAGAFDYVACPPDLIELERILASVLTKQPHRVTKAAPAAA